MSTAVQATKLDAAYRRIEVVNTDGGRTKYRKGGQARPGSDLDLAVDCFDPHRIGLVRRADGTPHLQQYGPGLPKTIVVRFINRPYPPPGALTPGGWQPEDRFEYEQEST